MPIVTGAPRSIAAERFVRLSTIAFGEEGAKVGRRPREEVRRPVPAAQVAGRPHRSVSALRIACGRLDEALGGRARGMLKARPKRSGLDFCSTDSASEPEHPQRPDRTRPNWPSTLSRDLFGLRPNDPKRVESEEDRSRNAERETEDRRHADGEFGQPTDDPT